MTDNQLISGFVSCPKHIELLLKDELIQLGTEEVSEGLAGVHATASTATWLNVVMWSRLANRVYLKLASAQCANKKDLYAAIAAIQWSPLCNEIPKTLSIKFNGTNKELNNSHFSSQVTKDAICDQLNEAYGFRPKVVSSDGHLSVYARLKYKQLDIYQDITGQSLHQRGYRGVNTLAPLKENLAAAILIRAGWPDLANQNHNLIDPMCGSGTLLTEGWQMACDIAPNARIKSHALFTWHGFNAQLWTKMLMAAEQRAEAGQASFKGQIIGVDHHKDSISQANKNLANLPHTKRISFQYQTLDKFRIPPRNNLIVCNPPYGVRLQKNYLSSWVQLRDWLSAKVNDAKAAVLTPDEAKGWLLGYRATQSYALLNGAIPIQLRLFEVSNDNKLTLPEGQLFALPAAAQMLANRLKKNKNQLQNWLDKNAIEAYRLYDADIPEYAVAIDCYQNHIHIQEYQAPKTIDEKKAALHLNHVMLAVQSVLQPKIEKIHLKTRQKQKDKQQYNKLNEQEDRFVVNEQGRKYLIDLEQYLDTGLFLDHRWLRNHVQKISKNNKVLNLFSYTGAISVAAAHGGAHSVVSVDTSKTYLKWAEENFALNGLRQQQHRFVRSDVMDFLARCSEQFDVIVTDPPTFSNSHSRDEDWSVQKDHAKMIRAAMKLLNKDGVLFFSNNFRKFSLGVDLKQEYNIKNITETSFDPDFIGSKIHHCYQMTHR
ncbi:bifunctional 23S rRNA (guanine(2069)-N(7))-methyltransferase RlmK/23S rRNA (guanine(2445)-N(2))-methyltransferase RlmL [Marinicella sp. S1101]|uniref:bifunctional 23S rRNA (guanine(2069)-N(7))-methyltransferase RlmK/23S rRNA (guanine(2445)-N(2))-methyltransferase RlmL n=1 Tax=Marinicella marina TaxID=2996016 RepID=UPI002260E674|nr:bifunctional 23S rRNA (guanine(2069)-N(7))-methyltransferase RlmK/23S rRNA (guanine(2445)-N(2))-methyltransferase RlmL [Marinicella marina]MCX7554174.1 bifunctional 23S rRNA (guanine(2069)-N(7))-methyltransferase RlmK/23S rRNA (guanine(2445)-N(2))-methyltransferase RlmL [Marinicella marina]MDJ1141133.1 bifunctional 23S rRNA (guanine(2069)-N(7))-methyltransferase RlmK/23S rRNA (guanine(2445)-N(2))-methyltransferase RlmL [Marinicella marina]